MQVTSNLAYRAHIERCKRLKVKPMHYSAWIKLALRCIAMGNRGAS